MGDERAEREERFRRLYHARKSAVRAYAWRRGPDAADDVVAETFAIAWQQLESVPAEPLPWLIAIARNVRLNQQRADRRRRERERRWAEGDVAPSFTGAVEERSALRSALEHMSERDCEILLLAAWERLDRAGLATALGCSKTAATVRLFRARKRLAAALANPGAESRISPTETQGRLLDEC
jgi:RNA polymerase sigma-70 factor (ECF subfamily)